MPVRAAHITTAFSLYSRFLLCSVSCLFFSLVCLFPGWVELLPSFNQLLNCTPESHLHSISLPSFCHKSLVHAPIIINLLFKPLWYSLAPEISGLHVCFLIPVSSSEPIVCLSCRMSFQVSVLTAQPTLAALTEFPHLRCL